MMQPAALTMLTLLCLAPSAPDRSVDPVEPLSPAVQRAVDKGIDWLKCNRGQDGSWRGAGGNGAYPVAMTSMAGMALICAGSTPTRGPHWQAVREAVAFVLRHVNAKSGLIAAIPDDARPMYAHGFATLFLAQVSGMEVDVRQQRQLQQVLGNAVRLIERSQTAAGGWYYTPDSTMDEGSVTVTQLQALRACRNVGIAVSSRTVERAVHYLEHSANADGGIRYRAGQDGPSLPAITAAAPAVMDSAGRYDNEVAERALAFVLRDPSIARFGGFQFYGNLYLAQALYQRGGQRWADYYDKMSAWLLRQQQPDGAWDGDGSGPVFATAVALIVLQLPLAFAPIYQR